MTFNHGGHPSKEQMEKMKSMGVRVFAIPLSPLKAALRCLPKLTSDLPLEVLFYTQPEFKQVVDKLFREEKFDMAFSFFMRTAEYLKHVDIPTVLIAEDCRTLYQKRSKASSKSVLQKLIRWWEVRKLEKYEPAIADKFDTVTFVTQTDIEEFERRNSNGHYALLTNGVDLSEFTLQNEPELRKDVLFFGKLDVWANKMMVSRIAERIFPIVQRELPDVHCHIAGARPQQLVQKYSSAKLHFHADVPDIKTYVATAAVFVHPHLGASGIQNKVLQAMAIGCPVVTTPTGIQGIEARHGKEVMIGLSDEEIAKHCTTLLQNPELRGELAHNARSLIERRYSWEIIYRQLDGVMQEVAERHGTTIS